MASELADSERGSGKVVGARVVVVEAIANEVLIRRLRRGIWADLWPDKHRRLHVEGFM